MDRCVDGLSTGLLSVSGVGEAVVAEACTGLKLECAIHVAADHSIYAGEDATLQQAQDRLAHLGAKSKRLPVQIASHSSWMHGAATAFAHTLQSVQFNQAQCPVALNTSGTTTRHAAALRQALSRQIDTTVQWSACMGSIAERRVSCVIEVGAGSALSRMWATHHPEVPVRAVEDFRDPRAISTLGGPPLQTPLRDSVQPPLSRHISRFVSRHDRDAWPVRRCRLPQRQHGSGDRSYSTTVMPGGR